VETNSEVIICPGRDCGQKLRIPNDRGRLEITCPKCRTNWFWSTNKPSEKQDDRKIFSAETTQKPSRRFPRQWIAFVVALIFIALGIWNEAWLATLLFTATSIIWFFCNRELSIVSTETLWQSAKGVVLETTSGIAGAAAIGFAFVIALITFLRFTITNPAAYPAWLPAFEINLIGLNNWLQSSDNKLRISIAYLGVIVSCVAASLLARRFNKDWRPIQTLSRTKRGMTRSLVVLQAIAFFTFFSQGPVDDYTLKLAQRERWLYGVAKRAEQEFEERTLIAEAIKTAAEEQKKNSKEEKNAFWSELAKLRGLIPPPATPNSSPIKSQPLAPFPGSPFQRSGWRPPSWPNAPPDVSTRIAEGRTLELKDFQPAKLSSPLSFREGPPPQAQSLTNATTLVAATIDLAKPEGVAIVAKAELPPVDPQAGFVWPLETDEHWKLAREQVAKQEQLADLAERRYGNAVEGVLEAISEFVGMEVSADPIVSAWIDLAISHFTDRVYGNLFAKDGNRWSSFTGHLRRLFNPRETAAEKLVKDVKERLLNDDRFGAGAAIAKLREYENTKAGREVNSFAEELAYRKVASSRSTESKISTASEYLTQHAGSSRAPSVRELLTQAKIQRAIEIAEAKKPRMIIYVRNTCPLSRHFRENTSHESDVIAEMSRFRSEYRDVDTATSAEQARFPHDKEALLPFIMFENSAGQVLGSISGQRALNPLSLLRKMQAIH